VLEAVYNKTVTTRWLYITAVQQVWCTTRQMYTGLNKTGVQVMYYKTYIELD